MTNEKLRAEFRRALPNFASKDVEDSPSAVNISREQKWRTNSSIPRARLKDSKREFQGCAPRPGTVSQGTVGGKPMHTYHDPVRDSGAGYLRTGRADRSRQLGWQVNKIPTLIPVGSSELDLDPSSLRHIDDQIEALRLIPGCVRRFLAEFPVGTLNVQVKSCRGFPLAIRPEIDSLGSL